jgi:predicted DNA-binding transcriptional regulator AlpA
MRQTSKVLPRSTRNSRAGAAAPANPSSTRRGSREEELVDEFVFSVIAHIKRHRKPMSVSELAPILGVSDGVLYRMVCEGDIPQLIVPGRRVTRFDPASIVFWLCKHNPLLNQGPESLLMPTTTHSEEVVISAPKLLPFTTLDRLSCPVCGVQPVRWPARLWLTIAGREACICDISYCEGGRPPIEDIASPVEAMMRGHSEVRPVCGGIMEPHLHLKCRCCDHVRLMRTKQRESR